MGKCWCEGSFHKSMNLYHFKVLIGQYDNITSDLLLLWGKLMSLYCPVWKQWLRPVKWGFLCLLLDETQLTFNPDCQCVWQLWRPVYCSLQDISKANKLMAVTSQHMRTFWKRIALKICWLLCFSKLSAVIKEPVWILSKWWKPCGCVWLYTKHPE